MSKGEWEERWRDPLVEDPFVGERVQLRVERIGTGEKLIHEGRILTADVYGYNMDPEPEGSYFVTAWRRRRLPETLLRITHEIEEIA